jgi:hypothetical protein
MTKVEGKNSNESVSILKLYSEKYVKILHLFSDKEEYAYGPVHALNASGDFFSYVIISLNVDVHSCPN